MGADVVCAIDPVLAGKIREDFAAGHGAVGTAERRAGTGVAARAGRGEPCNGLLPLLCARRATAYLKIVLHDDVEGAANYLSGIQTPRAQLLRAYFLRGSGRFAEAI